jgi:transcriptional regulator with XRE-family HTH domain
MKKATMNRKDLRAHRKRLGLSLAKVGAQVHVSPRTWARYESGERHIPEAIIHLFCALNRIRYGGT